MYNNFNEMYTYNGSLWIGSILCIRFVNELFWFYLKNAKDLT